MPYIDIRVNGTTTADSTFFISMIPSTNMLPANAGEVWTASAYLSMPAGSMMGISNLAFRIEEEDSGFGFLAWRTGENITPTSTLTRKEYTATLADPAVAYVRTFLRFSYSISTAVDITLRIVAAQFNHGAAASPPHITYY